MASILNIAGGQPFTAVQILWINFLITAPVGIALGLDKASPGLMKRMPRPRAASIMSPAVITTVGLAGVFMSVAINLLIVFGKNQYELPFSLKLDDFKKDLYNGTDKARNYSSDVTLRDGKLSWPARIEMNKPLRYRGYTFFQSSFEESPNGEQATILAVVENKGRLMPYIGTGVLGLGLLLHLMLAVTGRRRA
jgi:hypothetical protein